MEQKAKRFSKEWWILEAYTLALWWISYLPFAIFVGFFLHFNQAEWNGWIMSWFGIGTLYDILMSYPLSKAVIVFDDFARKKHWY